jgi:hypothetical protein
MLRNIHVIIRVGATLLSHTVAQTGAGYNQSKNEGAYCYQICVDTLTLTLSVLTRLKNGVFGSLA